MNDLAFVDLGEWIASILFSELQKKQAGDGGGMMPTPQPTQPPSMPVPSMPFLEGGMNGMMAQTNEHEHEHIPEELPTDDQPSEEMQPPKKGGMEIE